MSSHMIQCPKRKAHWKIFIAFAVFADQKLKPHIIMLTTMLYEFCFSLICFLPFCFLRFLFLALGKSQPLFKWNNVYDWFIVHYDNLKHWLRLFCAQHMYMPMSVWVLFVRFDYTHVRSSASTQYGPRQHDGSWFVCTLSESIWIWALHILWNPKATKEIQKWYRLNMECTQNGQRQSGI